MKKQPDILFFDNSWDSISGLQRYSFESMATVFEIFILYPDTNYAKQAAWAAFDELQRIERQLSRFIENSDICRINNLGANQPLLIGADVFESLQACILLFNETRGAFDVTIGSLLQCRFGEDNTPLTPSKEQLDFAIQHTGTHLIKLNTENHTVELLSDSVKIDLGGFGKGYTVDKMAELLRDWGIDIALIHGGNSSILALEAPVEMKGWPITLSNPADRKEILSYLYLKNQALGSSGLQKGQHIIDPRSAKPVKGKLATWVSAGDAATADALSTAFMVMSPEHIRGYCENHPDVKGMAKTGEQKDKDILYFGNWESESLP